jgi:hypothetical protein
MIHIEMNATDFELLRVNTMAWGPHWADHIADGQFRNATWAVGDSLAPEIRTDWGVAYWFPDWTTVILARSFLAHLGEDYQILADEAEMCVDLSPWVILTNYGRGWIRP